MSDVVARKDLELLVNSEYALIYLETWEEARAAEIVALVAEDLGVPLYTWAITTGFARAGGAPIYNSQTPAQALATIGGMRGDGLYLLKDFHKYFDQDVIIRKLRDLVQQFRRARRSIIITSPVVTIPIELEKDIARYSLGLPDEVGLYQLVGATARELMEEHHILNQLPPARLPEVVRSLRGLTLDEARRILTQAVLETRRFDASTIERIRDAKSQFIKDQGVLEFLNPEGGFGDMGGMKRLKDWLEKRRGALSPEAARYGLEPPKGILIMGMPGCGKSLCAKAVAHEWGMQLLRFDTGTLFEKYIGETEKNLRKSLQVAEAIAPSVLWIDEIEKMFPRASLNSEADGGLSLRIFGTFLNWMQERKAPVFVVATSNDISALPPELLRKGRVDEIFFVDLPELETRKNIFELHLSRRKQNPSRFNLDQLAAASDGFSGAEIEQAVTSALYSAFSTKAELSTDMVMKEIQSTYPLSVTMHERLERIREWAQERAVPAD